MLVRTTFIIIFGATCILLKSINNNNLVVMVTWSTAYTYLYFPELIRQTCTDTKEQIDLKIGSRFTLRACIFHKNILLDIPRSTQQVTPNLRSCIHAKRRLEINWQIDVKIKLKFIPKKAENQVKVSRKMYFSDSFPYRMVPYREATGNARARRDANAPENAAGSSSCSTKF